MEYLYISVNNYFPNGKCIMLQNYAWVKVPFKVKDFNVRNTKSLLICFHKSMLQLIFKKLPFIEFSFSRVATIIWKNLLKYSPFPIIYLFSQNICLLKKIFHFFINMSVQNTFFKKLWMLSFNGMSLLFMHIKIASQFLRFNDFRDFIFRTVSNLYKKLN